MRCFYYPLIACSLAFVAPGEAATGSTMPSTHVSPPVTPPAPTPQPSKPLVKPVLPKMPKPYGMPGVVGMQRGKWIGNDYLGHLAHAMSVSVEIVKTAQVPNVVTAEQLESDVRAFLTKADLVPDADVKEGPPLPFLQVLLFIYEVEKDKFAIFGALRIFEKIQVERKDFSPTGYWQGITWESQDIVSADNDNLKKQVDDLVKTLVTGFIKRYDLFNPPDKEK